MKGRITRLRRAVEKRNGWVGDIGYTQYGRDTTAYVEVFHVSVNHCHAIENELDFVEFEGIHGDHMELEVSL